MQTADEASSITDIVTTAERRDLMMPMMLGTAMAVTLGWIGLIGWGVLRLIGLLLG